MGVILLLRCGFRGLNSVGLILLDCLGTVLRGYCSGSGDGLFVGVVWGGCLLVFCCLVGAWWFWLALWI